MVDTNVRRVVARSVLGQGHAGPPRISADRLATQELLVTLDGDAARCTGAAALMELGAVVCTAKNPACNRCPIANACAWKNAGYPAYEGPFPAKQATYEGSDRQVRGIILRELRHSDMPIPRDFLNTLWLDPEQLARALHSLTSDGLVEETPDHPGHYHLAPR